MSNHCCPTPEPGEIDTSYRKTLWIVLAINVVMFMVEMVAGLVADSVSLQADALDFLGDAANYGISLFVLNKSMRMKAHSALLKAASMLLFGVWVLGQAAYQAINGALPTAEIMGVVGFIALFANIACFMMLSRHSREDSNRQSVWLCSRNDAIGNLAVLLAALAVYFTDSHWPDWIVAIIISFLALSAASKIARTAMRELRKK